MDNDVKILLCGDFCSTPSTNNIKLSDELTALFSTCDVKICNLESPILPPKTTPIKNRIYQSEDVPEFLKKVGFNLVTLANNHIFDYGQDGFLHTISTLRKNQIGYCGAGTYKDAYQVKVINIKNYKIGFLPLSFASKTGSFDEYRKTGLGYAYINSVQVPHIIWNSKSHVDKLIILPHDGIEYIDIPTPELRLLYYSFIDHGADAVIGCHPHCPQGWEIYKNKPILYSLGNFFFNSKKSPDSFTDLPYWYNGLAAILVINNNEINLQCIPTLNHRNRLLMLDNTQQTLEHTKKICNLLKNQDTYLNYYNSILMTEGNKRLRNLAVNFNSLTLSFGLKLLIRNFYNGITHAFYNDSQLTYLVGDTERNLIVQYIKNKK